MDDDDDDDDEIQNKYFKESRKQNGKEEKDSYDVYNYIG